MSLWLEREKVCRALPAYIRVFFLGALVGEGESHGEVFLLAYVSFLGAMVEEGYSSQ